MSRYDADDTYCYPGTDVLRNKAELTDANELDAYEGELSTLRSIEILENPIAGQFDLAHLQRIHLALFQDVYEWAGKIRTVDISRGNSRFANVRFIESAANELFNQLARENWLKELDASTLSAGLAHYLSEINALHPFREGNGRVQRIFISQLSQEAGYQLDYSDLEQEQIYQSMELAFKGDESMLANLILEHLDKFEP
jgi:cell filamentation protein